MSTPHVSGLAALLLAQNPGASNAQIRGLIENGADATGTMGQNLQAWSVHGRINHWHHGAEPAGLVGSWANQRGQFA
jgi:hypothetical protein